MVKARKKAQYKNGVKGKTREDRDRAREERRARNRALHDEAQRVLREARHAQRIVDPGITPHGSDEARLTDAGRPTLYTEALAERICALVATNTCSTQKILDSDPELPNLRAVQRWRHDHPEFGKAYDDAKKQQAELLADQVIDIADTPQIGIKVKETPLGTEVMHEDMLGHRKLQIESRRWYASVLNPQYSDKLELRGGLNNRNTNVSDPDELSDRELADIARAGRPASAESKASKGKRR